MKLGSFVISLGMLVLLAPPARLAAQEDLHCPRYTVIELGALGGTYGQALKNQEHTAGPPCCFEAAGR